MTQPVAGSLQESRAALEAFIDARFPGADEALRRAVHAVALLEAGERREEDETRVVAMTLEKDGSVSARSRKLLNLLTISFADLVKYVIKGSQIVLSDDQRLKTILAVLALIVDVSNNLTVELGEREAGVLFAVYQLGRTPLSVEQVADEYRRRFGQPIGHAEAAESLDRLKRLRVLRSVGDGRFIARERMVYERA